MLSLSGSDWLMDGLALVSSVCWLAVYVQALRIGFAKKVCCIPAEALALNFAWEFVFGFIWSPTEPYYNVIQMWVNRGWCVLDLGIAYTCLMWGFASWKGKLKLQTIWKPYFSGVLIFAFTVMGSLFREFGPSIQALSAFIIGALMSALFIRMAMRDPDQPKSIGWLKFIGSAAITVVYLQSFSDYQTIGVLGLGTILLDIMYLRILYSRREVVQSAPPSLARTVVIQAYD